MPMTKNKEGEEISKPSRKWNEMKKRKASLNSKAMNTLSSALEKTNFIEFRLVLMLTKFEESLKLSMRELK